MTIDTEIADLIQADIDGEASAIDKARIGARVEGDDETRTYRDGLQELCAELDALEAVEPPPHLRHIVVNALPSPANQRQAQESGLKRAFGALFGGAIPRHAMTFAAGALAAVALVTMAPESFQAPTDTSALAGTIAAPAPNAEQGLRLDLDEIAGAVTLSETGGIIALEFDVASTAPVEIVTGFAASAVRLSGFAQLQDGGTAISANDDSVTVKVDGQRRYAVYLDNSSGNAASISLRFYADGALIHEDQLHYEAVN